MAESYIQRAHRRAVEVCLEWLDALRPAAVSDTAGRESAKATQDLARVVDCVLALRGDPGRVAAPPYSGWQPGGSRVAARGQSLCGGGVGSNFTTTSKQGGECEGGAATALPPEVASREDEFLRAAAALIERVPALNGSAEELSHEIGHRAHRLRLDARALYADLTELAGRCEAGANPGGLLVKLLRGPAVKVKRA